MADAERPNEEQGSEAGALAAETADAAPAPKPAEAGEAKPEEQSTEPDPVLSAMSLEDLRKIEDPEQRKAAYKVWYDALSEEERAELPGVSEYERRERERSEADQEQAQQRSRQEQIKHYDDQAEEAVIALGNLVDNALYEMAGAAHGDEWRGMSDRERTEAFEKMGVNIDPQKIAGLLQYYADKKARVLAHDHVGAITGEIGRLFDELGGLTPEQAVAIRKSAGENPTQETLTRASLKALRERITEAAKVEAKAEMEADYKTRLQAELAAERVKLQKGIKTEPAPGRAEHTAIPADAERLERLAFGRDKNGNAATEEDKAWLAARN